MKLRYNLLLISGLVLLSAGLSGCGPVNALRAKDSLNQGVREFNKGKYDVAQAKFERALELDENLTNAQLYLARSLNAQFQQSLTPDMGVKTIDAYERIIKSNKDNPKAVDQALAFEAEVYKQLSDLDQDKAQEYRETRRDILLKRTELPIADDDTKAAVYYTIGQGFWNDSYNLSSKYKNQPIPADVAEKMKPDIAKGHEFLQKAVSIKPDYADAYAYEKLLFLEEKKIETNPARQKELDAKAAKAQDDFLRLRKAMEGTEAAAAK